MNTAIRHLLIPAPAQPPIAIAEDHWLAPSSKTRPGGWHLVYVRPRRPLDEVTPDGRVWECSCRSGIRAACAGRSATCRHVELVQVAISHV